ncbi:hypothetical protein CBS147311_9631 [Penicillium roqueforti]|nr:hypothetical protein CBS147311_9631 [Penicillium roqueforti]
MNKFALSSLLKRGTKTWHSEGQYGDYKSTIDLVLASDNLADLMTNYFGARKQRSAEGTDRIRKFRRYHRSPLYHVADALKHVDLETLEIINPFTLAPYDERVQINVNRQDEPQTEAGGLMQIAVSSSARNELVGFGVAIEKQPPRNRKLKFKTFSVTLGARAEQNPFSTELAAIAHMLKIVVGIKDYKITLLTSNKAAAFTLRNPRRQSGQEFVCQMYKLISRMRRNGNSIKFHWIPTTADNKLLGLAKEQARTAI